MSLAGPQELHRELRRSPGRLRRAVESWWASSWRALGDSGGFQGVAGRVPGKFWERSGRFRGPARVPGEFQKSSGRRRRSPEGAGRVPGEFLESSGAASAAHQEFSGRFRARVPSEFRAADFTRLQRCEQLLDEAQGKVHAHEEELASSRQTLETAPKELGVARQALEEVSARQHLSSPGASDLERRIDMLAQARVRLDRVALLCRLMTTSSDLGDMTLLVGFNVAPCLSFHTELPPSSARAREPASARASRKTPAASSRAPQSHSLRCAVGCSCRR